MLYYIIPGNEETINLFIIMIHKNTITKLFQLRILSSQQIIGGGLKGEHTQHVPLPPKIIKITKNHIFIKKI